MDAAAVGLSADVVWLLIWLVAVVADATGTGGEVFVLLVVLGAAAEEDGVRSAGVLVMLDSTVKETGGAKVELESASVELVLFFVETALVSTGSGVLSLVWLAVVVGGTVETEVVLTSDNAAVAPLSVVPGSVCEVVFCPAASETVLLAAVLAETVDVDVLLVSSVVDVVVLAVGLSTVESTSVDDDVVVTSGNVGVELLCAVDKAADVAVLLFVLLIVW